MNSKLTLSLEEAVIKKAKKYARKNNTSLSEIIENYFKLLTHDQKNESIEDKPTSKYYALFKLRGIAKLPTHFDYKTALSNALIERDRIIPKGKLQF